MYQENNNDNIQTKEESVKKLLDAYQRGERNFTQINLEMLIYQGLI